MAGAQRFLVGLIGSDLGPSLSPPLHEREADHLGVRYLYQRIDLDVLGLRAEDVGDLVAQAHRFGFAGLNITHPSKQAVVKYLDELSPEAAALGAVNTVVLRDRRAVGHNTDRSGFVAGFRRGLPDVRVRDVVLLGKESTTCLTCHDVHTGSSKKHRELAVVDSCQHCHPAGDPIKSHKTYEVHSQRCQY